MSTSKTVDNILVELENNLPRVNTRAKKTLVQIYSISTKMVAEEQQTDKVEEIAKLFQDLIVFLNEDLFATEESLHDDQINILHDQVKLKLNHLKEKCVISIIDIKLFNTVFSELVECIRSSFDIMSRIFENVLTRTKRMEDENKNLTAEIRGIELKFEQNERKYTKFAEQLEAMNVKELKRVQKEKVQETQILVRDLFVKCKDRLAEDIRNQNLPKNKINIFSNEKTNDDNLLANYPELHQILKKVSTEFGINNHIMLLHLQQKKKSNADFHLSDEFKTYAKSRQITKLYELSQFLDSQGMHPLDEEKLLQLQPVFTTVCKIINKQV